MLGSRNGQTAAGGLLGLVAGGPVGALAGAAGGRLFGGLMREGRRRNTASELALEEQALRISGERQRQDQIREQREAIASLPGLLGAATIPDRMVGPPRPGEMRATDQRLGMLGALAQMAPGAAGQSMLQQLFPTPAQPSRFGRTASDLESRLGRRLTEAELMQIGGLGPQGEDLESLQRRVAILQGIGALEDRQADRDRAARDEATGLEVEAAQAEGLASEARTLFADLAKLEGTLLEPGSSDAFAEGVRAIGGVAGPLLERAGAPIGTEIRRTNAARDDFGKSLARLRNAAVDQLVGDGATNAQRQQAAEGFPSAEMEPQAIVSGIRAFAEDRIRALRATGASQKAIKAFEDLLSVVGNVSGSANPERAELERLRAREAAQ